MPPPMGIHSVMNVKDESIKKVWLKAYKKELKTLVKAKTFTIKQLGSEEKVVPIMETNDGTQAQVQDRSPRRLSRQEH